PDTTAPSAGAPGMRLCRGWASRHRRYNAGVPGALMAIYQLGSKRPQIHPDAYVFETATLIGDIRMAAESSVWPGAVLRGDNEPIIIGHGSNVQDGSVLHTDEGFALRIADFVT